MTTALVVLNPSGGKLSAAEPITTENYRRLMPSPEEMRTAMDWFDETGFDVAVTSPNSFSISAGDDEFTTWFGTSDGPFDISTLPEPLATIVAAVEVEEPPDFGPGNP